MPKLCVACLPFFSLTITNTSQLVCVSKRKDPKYAGLWLCGSVAPSGHRSLHLPASRGGFQEMPQVVAVQEIPPDYNQRLYKDAAQCLYTAHWSTSVLSVKKKCRSVPLRLHLFILLVTIPVRCGPGPCEWSLWSDVVPVVRCGPGLAEAGHVVEQHNCTKFDASYVLFEHCLISCHLLSTVMCHGLLPGPSKIGLKFTPRLTNNSCHALLSKTSQIIIE